MSDVSVGDGRELYDFERPVDYVRKSIEDKLNELLREQPSFDPECSIYRVRKHLQKMNCIAYEPKVISIGPFHHDQQKFKDTENLKLRFFNSYQRRTNLSVQSIVEKVLNWEERARKYYSEIINMSSKEFVEMMVLDGCFVVEYLIKNVIYVFGENANMVHSSFYKVIDFDIQLDLIKLENQLPFFVLQDLFDLVPQPLSNTILFDSNVVAFLVKSGMLQTTNYTEVNQIRPRHLLDFFSRFFIDALDETHVHDFSYLPPSATQLHEAGVVLKKGAYGTRLLNISFKDGILKIPTLQIDDTFETWARNLLAFRQLDSAEDAISYFEFLNKLITTKKDVNLLIRKRIILNLAGFSDIEILILLNNLLKNIVIPYRNRFSHISVHLEEHCQRKRNKFLAAVRRDWMGSFRDKYFNTPWAFISVLAATFLLILTLIQTIYTVRSCSK